MWHLYFDLEEAEGITTPTFGQKLNPSDDPTDICPGCEYYLARLTLTAAREGRDAGSIQWDDYYPGFRPPTPWTGDLLC
ncbi:hypothetical protein [Paeniglutamicibacter cryotolerans]|uniref:Uncharacterized protein n=1 Tax=Paeniglutamicibacter cryotolerans TaxID=670079 RepID=A0A839QFZ9_9MICC|nr:hypothetical protein [Paeniglutamicibacter cryotolerans]MBB2994597.1 hypothetical protein [Paeniglutamicibacter cryotolerans]